MGKFDPADFNYERIREEDGVSHYQKILIKDVSVVTDIVELSYWSKQNIWVIFIEVINLKQFLPAYNIPDDHHHITLFVGRIKSGQDFRFLINRIAKDPKFLSQLGC